MITPAHPPPSQRLAYPNGQLSRRACRANLMLMSRLIIGNQLTEETAEGEGALPPEYRRFLSVISHRMVWFAQDGDVLVLPSHPGEGFLAYVRRINGLAEGEPLILVPPPGRRGAELLYDDRLAAPEFVAGLRTLIAERGVDRVFPFHFGSAVLRLARETGLDGPFGGVAFLAERGGELVNSKAAFRAIGAGNGVPIPEGRVCLAPAEFIAAATRVMEAVRALGYRSYAGLDAIVTPAGRVLFNEVNARVAGSTHLDAVARRAVGDDYLTARVLISRNRVPWPTFPAAEALLAEHGLAFDPAGRTGILLTGDDDAPDGPTGQFLIVGRDHAHAEELERRAVRAFGLAGDSAADPADDPAHGSGDDLAGDLAGDAPEDRVGDPAAGPVSNPAIDRAIDPAIDPAERRAADSTKCRAADSAGRRVADPAERWAADRAERRAIDPAGRRAADLAEAGV